MASQVFPSETSQRTAVLLIDDNYEHRKCWSAALRNSPFHYWVLEADSGDSGLALYRHQRVDCVILDLDMPESGFFTLVRLIPDPKRPQVPVIILTYLMHPSLFELAKCLVKQHSSPEELHTTIQQGVTAVKSTQQSSDSTP